MPDEVATRMAQAYEAWVGSVMFHNPEMPGDEAREFVQAQLRDGQDTVVRDLVTLRDKPHHIDITWNDKVRGGHWCPGYWDCLACDPG